MAKKIHVIELKEVEIVQVENTDEFVETAKNKRKYPVYLTNYALSRGYDSGILKSSLISDLVLIKNKMGKSTGNKEDEAANLIAEIDEKKILDVIYLAFIGANPKSNLTKDDFLQQYHANYTDSLLLYFEIISSAVEADPNAFAKGLAKSTEQSEKKLESHT